MNTCNNIELSSVLFVVKNILTIIQIIVPIILLITIVISLYQAMLNPDKKDIKKSIIIRLAAAIIVFFIPMLINITMGILGEDYNFSNCWNNAKNTNNNSSYINSNDKAKQVIPTTDDYEKGDSKNNNTSTTSFNLEHAIKVHDNIHYEGNSNLPWQGKTVGNYGGDIGAYTEAINILNETDYRIYEVYKVIVSKHQDITTTQYNIAKLNDVHDYYNIKTTTIKANIESIDNALKKGKLVHGVSSSNAWTDDKGNHKEWKGTHNGLIFYYDGKYYHMKAAGSINQNNSIYTKEQLQLWINGSTVKNYWTYEKK